MKPDPVASMSPPAGGRIPALDGIRGYAVLLILQLHAFVGFVPADALGRAWKSVVDLGWCGVDLFFVLSGYLITGILRRQREAGIGLRVFYWHRALRILPVYYGALAGMLAVVLILGKRLSGLYGFVPGSEGVWPWLFAHLGNVYFVTHSDWPRPVTHFWSLGIEEQFYLVWPWIVMIGRRRLLMLLCTVGFVAAPVLRAACLRYLPDPAAYVLPFARMDALLAGGFLALLLEDPEAGRRHAWPARVLALTSVLGLAIVLRLQGDGSPSGRPMSIMGYSCWALLFASLIGAAVTSARGSWIRRATEGRLLRAFGTYSYAIYVLHYPLLFAAEWLLFSKLRLVGPEAHARLGFYVPFAIGFIACLLGIGWLSWHGFEKRILRYKALLDPQRPPDEDSRVVVPAK